MVVRLLDTNVLLRYFTRDHEVMAQHALELLLRVENGQERVATSSLVIFEVVFTLQKFYTKPRAEIRSLLLPILSMQGLILEGKPVFERALDLYVAHNVSFADAFNAAYAEAIGITEVYSWDRGFDRLPNVTRIEPSANS